MDIDDLTPAGGGSLRRPAAPPTWEPVATFRETRFVHPDEYWHPFGGELERHHSNRPGFREDHRKAGHVELPPHEETARMIRVALRPGG